MKINKQITNLEIADLLRNISASYTIKDETKNKFKIIAYERAADAIEHLSSDAKDLWDDGKLDEVPGVGESIAHDLGEIFSRGYSLHINEILKGVPESVFELLPIEGIGPKTAFKLVNTFKIKSPGAVEKLLELAKNNKIESIEGFGKDSQDEIIKSINIYKSRSKRYLFPFAENIAYEIIEWMKECQFVKSIDVLGSLRRKCSTIGDIDILASSDSHKEVIDHFTNYKNVKRILEKGETKSSIVLPSGMQIDLLCVDPKSYGSALQHFTGSKHHNIALREYAKDLIPSLSLSEYGIKNVANNKIKYFDSESDFYNALNMDYIPPELREDEGEIDAAVNKKLPKLVEYSQIKGDLQIHSNFDIETSHDLGMSSYVEIAEKANILLYEYVAFTEHNPSRSKHKESEITDLIKRKEESVNTFNEKIKGKYEFFKHAFNSLEVDIDTKGNLPLNDEALKHLEFILVSIHSSFRMDKNEMTKRILNALSYPKVKIFAHPTARKLNEREGIELDWNLIFEKCLNNNIFIEINCDPMRLDLPDYLVREAVNKGVFLTLGTDSHHVDHMDNMKYGVDVAKRGWCESNNILNTSPYEKLCKMLL